MWRNLCGTLVAVLFLVVSPLSAQAAEPERAPSASPALSEIDRMVGELASIPGLEWVGPAWGELKSTWGGILSCAATGETSGGNTSSCGPLWDYDGWSSTRGDVRGSSTWIPGNEPGPAPRIVIGDTQGGNGGGGKPQPLGAHVAADGKFPNPACDKGPGTCDGGNPGGGSPVSRLEPGPAPLSSQKVGDNEGGNPHEPPPRPQGNHVERGGNHPIERSLYRTGDDIFSGGNTGPGRPVAGRYGECSGGNYCGGRPSSRGILRDPPAGE